MKSAIESARNEPGISTNVRPCDGDHVMRISEGAIDCSINAHTADNLCNEAILAAIIAGNRAPKSEVTSDDLSIRRACCESRFSHEMARISVAGKMVTLK